MVFLEEAGQRVKDLSSPLADEGVSILFISTYISDFILVKFEQLLEVTKILERSGFSFTVEDDDESLSASTASIAAAGRNRDSSSAYSSGSRMRGSLLNEDGDRGERSRGVSTNGRRTRSGSLSGTLGTGFRPSPSTEIRPEEVFVASPTSSPLVLPGSPDTAPTTPATSALNSRRPSLRAGDDVVSGDGLMILPDELVCVGLSQAHEAIWKSKIVSALFFPERVLPPSPPPRPSNSRRASQTLSPSHFDALTLTPHLQALPRETRSLSVDSTYSTSSTSSYLSSSPDVAPFSLDSLRTNQSRYPVPFIALTQTQETVSFTSDIRLLRSLFSEEEESEMVYAVGHGGLRGIWQGEEEEDGEKEETEVERNRERLLKKQNSVRSRGRRGRRQGEKSEGVRSGSEQGEEEVESDWERVEQEDLEKGERERRDRREKARAAGEGGRRILKCLQLDLASFPIG